ncbi:MAG: 2-5 ligase [Eubacterium sp.]|jgi:2'-5' RNA ligase|nr:2-5 ligase [Eubacterium sp.]
MSEKNLYLLAAFDDATSKSMAMINKKLNEAGIFGRQTPGIPYHITLTRYTSDREEEIKQLLQDICAATNSFDINFSHIGLFGLEVLFLAPDMTYELLELYKNLDRDSIKDARGWTPHATILIDDARNIQSALPIMAQNFKQLRASIKSVCLYEFYPTRLIAQYNLQ